MDDSDRLAPGEVREDHQTDAVGDYVLLQSGSARLAQLRRCGSARPVPLPAGFVPTALAPGWVAGVTRVSHRAVAVDLVRLSDRRRFRVTGLPPAALAGSISLHDLGGLVFTQKRLWMEGSAAQGIFSVTLPQK